MMEAVDMTTIPRMPWHQKLAFSFGHILNDLCGAMWFSLLLVFFQYIVRFPAQLAGFLMMWGQIVHAISTPLIGYESDRIDGFCCFAKRKSWHFIGTIAVIVAFPFVFMSCVICDDESSSWSQFVYYAPFIAIFQFGWAAGQVSHMTLMSQLAFHSSDRMVLSGLRNAGTLLSSIVVFTLGAVFFGPSHTKQWLPADESKFVMLMIIVEMVGLTCSIIFHVGLREKSNCSPSRDSTGLVDLTPANTMTCFDWLKEPQFYLVSLLYMFSRLIVNVSGAYFPFYAFETLRLNKEFMTVLPLIMNITGFILSLLMRCCVTSRNAQKAALLVGILLTIGGCGWLGAIHAYELIPFQVIGPAIFIGASGSILTVTSLVMTTDVIGSHTVSGAFVFGAMSPMDKLASGLAILLIQLFTPYSFTGITSVSAAYYNIIMVYVIGSFGLALLILMFFVWPTKLGQLRKFAGATAHRQNGAVRSTANRSDDETRYLLDGLNTLRISTGKDKPTDTAVRLMISPPVWRKTSLANGHAT